MNYIEQFNAFTVKSAGILSPGATALYVRLFQLNNQHHWAEYFPASLSLLQAMTRTGSINTIRSWQEELESHGFIECRRGGHKKPNLYKLPQLYVSISDTKTDIKTDTYTDTKTDIKTDSIKNINIKEKEKKSASHSKKSSPKIQYAEAVTMTNDEYSSLMGKVGSKEAASWCIEKLNNYKLSSGKKYKSDYRAILSWVLDSLPPQFRRVAATPVPTLSQDEQEKRRRERQDYDDMLAALAEGGT